MFSTASRFSIFSTLSVAALTLALAALPGCEPEKSDCDRALELSEECGGELLGWTCDGVDNEDVAELADADDCDDFLEREDAIIARLNCENVTRWREECDPEGDCPITCDSFRGDQQRLSWIETCDDYWFVCDSIE